MLQTLVPRQPATRRGHARPHAHARPDTDKRADSNAHDAGPAHKSAAGDQHPAPTAVKDPRPNTTQQYTGAAAEQYAQVDVTLLSAGVRQKRL